MSEMKIYQSHEGIVGMSDSSRKLERIALPEDLSGKSLLDIGCNEGLFCYWAKQRGASRVVGIDFDKPRLDFATEKYSSKGIDFRLQSWAKLPDGPFDIVLWMSAMHYEQNPKQVFDSIKRIIAPGGVLILECGVVDRAGKEMVRVQRHGDARFYPTTELLLSEFLRGYAVRRFYRPEATPGDPVPREIFHCTLQQPIVNIVSGGSGLGKSFFAHRLSESATKTYSTDVLITRIAKGQFHHSSLEKAIRDLWTPDNLFSVHKGIDDQNLTEDFANLLAEFVAPDDEVVIFEGFMSEPLRKALSRKLSSFAIVWHTVRYLP